MSDPEKPSPVVASINDSNELYAVEEGMVKDAQEDNNVFSRTEGGPDFRGLSCFGATILIVKTQIGLGVLGIPFTFQSLGFFPGILSLVILCALTTWTGIVVGKFRLNHPQVHSIGDAAHLLFGPAGREIMGVGAWLLWILFYGAGLITLSIALNTFSNHALCTMAFVGIGAAISFVIALLARTMKALSWCGYVAVVSVLTGVWIVAIACLTQSVPAAAPPGEPVHKNVVAFAKGSSFATIGAAVSTQVFSLCGTPTFFTIHAEMKDQKKYSRALYMGQAIVSLNYIAVGCIMYGKVGDYVASPALGSAGPYIKKIAYGVSFPALLFACFFQAHVAGKYALVRILRNTRHLQSNSFVHWMTWIAVMAVVIVLGLIIAGAIPFFGDLLGLTGALLGTSFTLIIPGLMALYELANPDLQPGDGHLAWFRKSQRNWMSSRKNMAIAAVSWIAIIGGIYITVSGTYGSIVSIIDGYKDGTVGSAFSCQDNST